jgi:hypothetical protein
MTTKITHTDLNVGIEVALIKDEGKHTVRVVDLDSGNVVMVRTYTGPGMNMKAWALYTKHVKSIDKVPAGTTMEL